MSEHLQFENQALHSSQYILKYIIQVNFQFKQYIFIMKNIAKITFSNTIHEIINGNVCNIHKNYMLYLDKNHINTL